MSEEILLLKGQEILFKNATKYFILEERIDFVLKGKKVFGFEK